MTLSLLFSVLTGAAGVDKEFAVLLLLNLAMAGNELAQYMYVIVHFQTVVVHLEYLGLGLEEEHQAEGAAYFLLADAVAGLAGKKLGTFIIEDAAFHPAVGNAFNIVGVHTVNIALENFSHFYHLITRL